MSSQPPSLATRLRQVRLNRRADNAPRTAATRDLAKVALLVPTITVVVIAFALVVVRLLAGEGLSGIGSATAAGWLAVNQVPITIGGVTLGLLPMLPTLVVCAGTIAVVAASARSAREVPDLAGTIGASLGGSLLFTALSLAVVADGSAMTPIESPNSLAAFAFTLLVQGTAVAIGIAIASLRPILDEFAVPATERVGGRGGLIAFGVLVVGGAIVVLLGILAGWGDVSAMIADGNSVDGYLGLTVLSILYLPNLVIGTAAVSVGVSAHLGTTVIDTFDVSRGAVPPLPIVGILPDEGLGAIGGVLFVIPLVAGGLLGWYCRSNDPIRHLRAVGIGAAVAAAAMVLLTGIAGGQLGELGDSGVSVATTGVFTFAWLALSGAVVVGVMMVAGGGLPAVRKRAAAPTDEDESDDALAVAEDKTADGSAEPDEAADDAETDEELGDDLADWLPIDDADANPAAEPDEPAAEATEGEHRR